MGKRADGFHEIRSIMQTINLCDTIHFQSGSSTSLKSDLPDWTPEESLVAKAVSLLQETTGCSKGVTIEIKKRIPLLAGLGGDSSDAAAALRGINQTWELGLTQDKLLELAAQLGSDVPFFFYGGTAYAEGRGEIITPLPRLPHRWVVLVVPALPRQPGKTAQLYSRLNTEHYTDGQKSQGLADMLKHGNEFTTSLIFNTFENILFIPPGKISRQHEYLMKIGADNVHLAGSGPTLFTLLEDKSPAENLYLRCRQQGMETYLAETVRGFR